MLDEFDIDARSIGANRPVFCVAEIGLNHNGNIEIAKRSIDAAKQAGADAVKFQSYRTKDFISDRSLSYEYTSQGSQVVESQWELFQRCELTHEHLLELADYCKSQDIIFHATPTSPTGVADLVAIGCPVLKNGSDFLTHLDLIAEMGYSGLPTVISTGMATQGEVDSAVETFQATGNDQLVVLHCTSTYPAATSELNLRAIQTLRARFGCLTGFSDHSIGVSASVIAVALGACWIEKHFTLNKNLPGPDHRFSADPAEMETLVGAVRSAETALGEARIAPSPGESLARTSFRLSCIAVRALPCGHTLDNSDVAFGRPGTGFPPATRKMLTGRTLRKSVPLGHVFTDGDFR